jgi:hypothetical protein
MNNQEAERIPIVGFLAAVGVLPEKVRNGNAWYASPFATEPGTRLKVDLKTNRWHEPETRTGGNILNLVMQLNRTEILGALIILQKPELSKTNN